MNLEDFIDGYPGVEHALRAVRAQTLGHERAETFFRRLADHVLAEGDVAYLASLGANALRLPVKHRRLEQAVRWCAAHGVYAIIDLHAAHGWQNTDWHSDNATRLDAPFTDNLVYSSHNYTGARFGPGRYPGGEIWGVRWDRAAQREIFLASEGARFPERHDVPLWVGEFGSVNSGPPEQEQDRLRAIAGQIDVFEEFGRPRGRDPPRPATRTTTRRRTF